jgi:hypothetical protein
MLLRLLVELYSIQNLREDGGIQRRALYRSYERMRIAECGPWTVWGFRSTGTRYVRWGDSVLDVHRRAPTKDERADGKNDAQDLFARLDLLTALHLLDWRAHVFESADDSAEVVLRCGMGGSEGIEDRLGQAADDAGFALLGEGQAVRLSEDGYRLVPMPRHLGRVEMCDVARLRYRPRTSLTAAWYAELQSDCAEWLGRFERLSPSRAPTVAATR